MKMKSLVALAIAAILAGCATSPERQAKLAELARTTPTCSGKEDCDAKWEAAQLWVVHNAGWKIQTQSNVLIETYNPVNHSPNIAVRVTKEPIGSGRYQFVVKVWCANMFGCHPDSWDAALKFNREIGRAGPYAAQHDTDGAKTAASPAPHAERQQVGRYGYNVRQLPEVRACNPYPVEQLNAQGGGREHYTVACTNGEAVAVQCESSECRVLR